MTIKNMRTGFNKYQQGDEKAKALYHAAFGKQADATKVDSTIQALETGTLEAQVATKRPRNKAIAATNWSPDPDKNGHWLPKTSVFSAQFHGKGKKPLTDAGRAGTVIHEATHKLSSTGDNVNDAGNIIKGNEDGKESGETGYSSNHNAHKTVADIEKDQKYTAVRDKVKNMHDNAESYTLFASLCSQPGALERRDVHRWNRALRAGNQGQLTYLARRNNCKLPNAAAKKAAINAAATKATKSATTNAPATNAPATKPLATKPLAAKPLAAKPPVTKPPVKNVSTTKPPAKNGSATKPLAKNAAARKVPAPKLPAKKAAAAKAPTAKAPARNVAATKAFAVKGLAKESAKPAAKPAASKKQPVALPASRSNSTPATEVLVGTAAEAPAAKAPAKKGVKPAGAPAALRKSPGTGPASRPGAAPQKAPVPKASKVAVANGKK
ncbi:hypothetical protein DXG01_012459 [Tephrocybe rancida]|nr:hypothetical protein DXG01_012459 [Tephrocybe rancida]